MVAPHSWPAELMGELSLRTSQAKTQHWNISDCFLALLSVTVSVSHGLLSPWGDKSSLRICEVQPKTEQV